jgi:CheY-like chemotaxis protein
MIEDCLTDARLIAWELEQAAYDLMMRRVETAAELVAALDEAVWDLVICDYRLPCFNAEDALNLIRGRLGGAAWICHSSWFQAPSTSAQPAT